MSGNLALRYAALNALYAAIAKNYGLSGIDAVHQEFAIDPSMEQKLEAKQTEEVGFMGQINVAPVDELQGQTLGLFAARMIGSGIGNSSTRRDPKDVSGLDSRQFQLFETLFDTMMPWTKIDTWAKFPNFLQLYSQAVAIATAQTRISIGFNGETRFLPPASSDPLANPMGEDLNIGWLQKLRLERPDHVMGRALVGAPGAQTATGAAVPIEIGAAETIKSLDALAYDLISGMPSWARSSTELVVIVSQDLVDAKYFPMINRPLAATIDSGKSTSDEVVSDIVLSAKQIGGRRAAIVPFFPEGTMFVTPLKNLSLYYQSGARRRYVKDEPEYRRGLVDYNSSNEGYVIESTDHAVLAENIVFT